MNQIIEYIINYLIAVGIPTLLIDLIVINKIAEKRITHHNFNINDQEILHKLEQGLESVNGNICGENYSEKEIRLIYLMYTRQEYPMINSPKYQLDPLKFYKGLGSLNEKDIEDLEKKGLLKKNDGKFILDQEKAWRIFCSLLPEEEKNTIIDKVNQRKKFFYNIKDQLVQIGNEDSSVVEEINSTFPYDINLSTFSGVTIEKKALEDEIIERVKNGHSVNMLILHPKIGEFLEGEQPQAKKDYHNTLSWYKDTLKKIKENKYRGKFELRIVGNRDFAYLRGVIVNYGHDCLNENIYYYRHYLTVYLPFSTRGSHCEAISVSHETNLYYILNRYFQDAWNHAIRPGLWNNFISLFSKELWLSWIFVCVSSGSYLISRTMNIQNNSFINFASLGVFAFGIRPIVEKIIKIILNACNVVDLP
jgi:hypothetical protein